LIRHFLNRQFLAFLAVGGTAALLHWLARILLSRWLDFSIAVAAAYAVGMLVAFGLNSAFVFPGSAKPRRRQALEFALVNLAFFPVVWGATMLLERAFTAAGVVRHTQALAHGVAVLIPAFATFLIYKFFTFKGARFGRT
jgi:putative flippase GtrA